MNKKYILTEEYKNIIVSDNQSKRVFRIMAIRSFGGVKAGQLGGFVEKEENLSHEGDCFVFDDAVVCDDARVEKNSLVMDNALIFGNALLTDNAIVVDNAILKDRVRF